ncbi:winged helix-turn-helix domain-containing protein [Propionibacteriaceae bacterium Y1923]
MATAPTVRLTLPQARRIALHAQGFGKPRPTGRAVTMRDVQAQVRRLAQFQIDTINVVERAHYFPLFSRLGSYDKALLDRALSTAPRRLFEYWGHAASVIDVDLQPALRPRMGRSGEGWAPSLARALAEHPGLDRFILDELAQRGPLTARQVEYHEGPRSKADWGWNWSAVKSVLEAMFAAGLVTSAGRNASFERRYALPEQVLPGRVLAEPDPSDDQATTTLVRRSAQALGVASTKCLADYFRLSQAATSRAVADLVAAGDLVPAAVDGWGRQVWLWSGHLGSSGVQLPPPVRARALVSPFDSLVFERRRTEELFGFTYRIEIYVPEPKRRYGYYVYPFLLDDQFVARVDLKADRAAGTLLVRSAWVEEHAADRAPRVAAELAEELAELGRWTGCEQVVVEPRGTLSGELAQAVGSS